MDLNERARALPNEPGVYLFKNERGAILYIGKAQNLRARVRSYLAGGDGRYQIPALIERARDVDVTAAGRGCSGWRRRRFSTHQTCSTSASFDRFFFITTSVPDGTDRCSTPSVSRPIR